MDMVGGKGGSVGGWKKKKGGWKKKRGAGRRRRRACLRACSKSPDLSALYHIDKSEVI